MYCDTMKTALGAGLGRKTMEKMGCSLAQVYGPHLNTVLIKTELSSGLYFLVTCRSVEAQLTTGH